MIVCVSQNQTQSQTQNNTQTQTNNNNNNQSIEFNPEIKIENENENRIEGGNVDVRVEGGQVLGVATVEGKPAVIGQAAVGVSELPKTGLPLAGVGLASLLPFGLRMRRADKNSLKDKNEDSANSVWTGKQLKS